MIDSDDVVEWGCGCVVVILTIAVAAGLLYAATLIVHAAWTR